MENISTIYYVLACNNGYYCNGNFTQSLIKAQKFADINVIAKIAVDLESHSYENVKVHRLGLLNGSIDYHNL